MKKNKYILIGLGLGLTIPVIASTLSFENVFANENEIPKLNVYMNGNGSPKLEWATEILEENVLNKSSFEKDDELPNLIYNNKHGEQFFVNDTASTGISSIKIGNTQNHKGNFYSYPTTSSSYSNITFNNKKYIENGTKLSVSMKVKTDSKLIIEPTGNGGKVDKQITLKTRINADREFYFDKKVLKGDNYFYLNIKDAIYLSERLKQVNGIHYVASKVSTNGGYNYLEIKSVDIETGKVSLAAKFDENFEAGSLILSHRKVNPVTFINRTVENTNNEWVTLNFNSNVFNSDEYNTLLRGFDFWIKTSSFGNSYIDDVTFGYATEVEIFRNNASIYKGFLSDFEDTSMKDKIKPNKVETINTTISNDLTVNINPIKPLDTSNFVDYTIQAIANNGSRSEMSKKHTIDTATGVKKYKYTINSSKNTPTTLANTTNGLDFNVPISQLNLENDYIHIQAIDGANNASSITTYKLKDIVDMDKINSLYDSLNKVEDSMNYNEFIEFIEEVESMYGTNIPLDVKNRIQELASYHNANTAFLLLLEGDFILTTSDITSFGKTKLTAKKQILYTNFAKEFNIIDARGTQQGYTVTVSATPFIEDTFDGFVGQPVQLPIGTLALNPVNEVQQIGLVHNSQKPTAQTINSTIIDSGSVNILQAGKGQGMGEFVFNFGDKPLSMVVDSTTAKIDNVNYPSGTTPYTSTITWNLITGP